MLLNELFHRHRQDLTEVHHAYDELSYKTEFQPLRGGDTVRVYHGFRNRTDAVNAARHGLSGREKADRVYSYEFDNNPHGLFVTLSRKVATEFAREVIMEFTARLEDLEAPVWPGGSYTVQGGMSQYFGHGAKGRAARRQRQRDAEQQTGQEVEKHPDELRHVAKSDKKYLAYLLTNSREYQALFVGLLKPSDITAFYVSQDPGRINAEWDRLTPEEFLERYADTKVKGDGNKIFAPYEEFDGEEFIRRVDAEYSRDAVETLGWMWGKVMAAPPAKRASTFVGYFEPFLWQHQFAPAIRWFRQRFAKQPAV